MNINNGKNVNFEIDLEKYEGLVDREVIRHVLRDIGEIDKRVLVLGADATASCAGNFFRDRFPERSFELGIAEPNMITVAAGLAKTGYIPLCGIFGFLVTRAAEQIKLDACYNKNNIKIISSASGFDMHAGGVTHHSNEDISILRTFPNMLIVQPASPLETVLASYYSILVHDGPAYLRLTRFMKKEIYTKDEIRFQIGKANILRDGGDITIIATGGRPVIAALEAAEGLAKEGIQSRIVNMHTIKPIDEETILKAARETKGIITVEEGNIAGGLGAAVAEVVSEKNPTYVKILGIPYNEFTVIGHSPDELCQYFGISTENIVKNAKNILKKN